MIKQLKALTIATMVSGTFLFGGTAYAFQEIEDKTPIFAYGNALSEEQKEETLKMFSIEESESIQTVEVIGQDLMTYINNPHTDSNMFSSALITPLESKNDSVVVKVVTPQNITQVTDSQYANAVITAGANNVEIEIASPVVVTGHSALVGIYKAFDEKGVQLDKERMEVAQDELDLLAELSQENELKEGFNTESLSNTMIDIKQELSKLDSKDKLTDEAINFAVNQAIKKNGLEGIITPEQVFDLVDFAKKYSTTDAIKDVDVANKLNELSKDVTDKLKGATDSLGNKINETGIFEKVKEFFTNLFNSIVGLFKSDDVQEQPLEQETVTEQQEQPLEQETEIEQEQSLEQETVTEQEQSLEQETEIEREPQTIEEEVQETEQVQDEEDVQVEENVQ